MTNFYRAMLCIAQTVLAHYVCSSVTRWYSVEMAQHINFFSASGSKRYGNIPTGTPLMGASNAMGYEKSIFD